jgi:hypothetical protein
MYFIRPKTKEELFNLRHASLRNVIERIFGVLKRRFRILLLAPEYRMEIQNRLPAALCALHNFIRTHDPNETEVQEIGVDRDEGIPGPFIPEIEPEPDEPEPDEPVEAEERTNPNRNQATALTRRDRIASELWAQYQGVLRDREGGIDESDEDDAMEDNDSEFEGVTGMDSEM